MEQLLKPDKVSQILGIQVSSLYQLVHEKRIPFIKVSHKAVRFRESELTEWLKQGGAGPCTRQRPGKVRKPRAARAAKSSVDQLVESAKAEAGSK
ncbi:MAG: helix-turn-helix transcriptional regulator [Dissulfurispiraceae bacterium]